MRETVLVVILFCLYFGAMVYARELPSVVLLGDSITVGYGPILASHPQCNIEVDVLAKSGQPTSWMLAEYCTRVAHKGYKTAVVLGGVNDIASGVPVPEIEANLSAIAQEAKAENMNVVFLTLLPWRDYPSWSPKL